MFKVGDLINIKPKGEYNGDCTCVILRVEPQNPRMWYQAKPIGTTQDKENHTWCGCLWVWNKDITTPIPDTV